MTNLTPCGHCIKCDKIDSSRGKFVYAIPAMSFNCAKEMLVLLVRSVANWRMRLGIL